MLASEGTKAWQSLKTEADRRATPHQSPEGDSFPSRGSLDVRSESSETRGAIGGIKYKVSNANGRSTITAVTTGKVAEVVKDTNTARKKLIEYAKKMFPKSVTNTDTGNEIGIARNGIDKFLSGRITKEKYATGFKIPDLVKSATKVGEAGNKKNTDGIVGYDYYENSIQIDGKDYTAHIRVRKTRMGDKYYGHTISQIVDQIKIEPTARSSEENSTVHPVNATGSTDSISKDDSTVNSKDMHVSVK